MRRVRLGVLAIIAVVTLAAVLVPATPSFAALIAWDGGGDGSTWLDPENWNPDQIPADGDAVVVGSGADVFAGLDGTMVQLADLSIDSGATVTAFGLTFLRLQNLHISGALVIDVSARIEVNGFAVVNGTLTINEEGVLQIFGTSGVVGLQGNGQVVMQPVGGGTEPPSIEILDTALPFNDVVFVIEQFVTLKGGPNGIAGVIRSVNDSTSATFIEQQGTILADGEGDFIIGQGDGEQTFLNTGTIEVGPLAIFDIHTVGNTNDGVLIVREQGVVRSERTALANGLFGTLSGSGRVEADVTNDGVISPGLSPGPLHIVGDLSLGSSGAVHVQIEGTIPGLGFDTIDVTGVVTVDGALEVSRPTDFSPADTDVFGIITGSSLTGTFAATSGLDLGDGRTLIPTYDGDSVDLAVGTSSVSIAISETIAVTDGVAVLPPVIIDVSEAIAVMDGAEVVPPLHIVVNEAITLTDGVDVIPPITIVVSENIAVTDDVAVLPPVSIAITEPIAVSDDSTVSPPVTIAISEAIAVTDGVVTVPPIAIDITEAIFVSDEAGAAAPTSITITETITLADDVDVTSGLEPGTADLRIILAAIDPASVPAGTEAPFTATVTNLGPDPVAPEVTVEMEHPSQADWTTAPLGAVVDTTLRVTLGELASGASQDVSFGVTFDALGAHDLTASVSGAHTELDPSNDMAMTTQVVDLPFDVPGVRLTAIDVSGADTTDGEPLAVVGAYVPSALVAGAPPGDLFVPTALTPDVAPSATFLPTPSLTAPDTLFSPDVGSLPGTLSLPDFTTWPPAEIAIAPPVDWVTGSISVPTLTDWAPVGRLLFEDATTDTEVLDRADTTLVISDAASAGLRIAATGGTADASLGFCGGGFTAQLGDGDAGTFTCGSLTVEVVSGEIVIALDADTQVVMPSPSTTLIDGGTAGNWDIEVLADGPITVVVDGQTFEVGEGETAPRAPTAVDDHAKVDSPFGTFIDVAANDTDPDADLDPTSVVIVDPPPHGTAAVRNDGTVDYVPVAGYTGPDSFEYRICDATGLCDVAVVTIDVTYADQPDCPRRKKCDPDPPVNGEPDGGPPAGDVPPGQKKKR